MWCWGCAVGLLVRWSGLVLGMDIGYVVVRSWLGRDVDVDDGMEARWGVWFMLGWVWHVRFWALLEWFDGGWLDEAPRKAFPEVVTRLGNETFTI